MASMNRRMECVRFFTRVVRVLFIVYAPFSARILTGFQQKMERGNIKTYLGIENRNGDAGSSASLWRYVFAAYADATEIYVEKKRESDTVFNCYCKN